MNDLTLWPFAIITFIGVIVFVYGVLLTYIDHKARATQMDELLTLLENHLKINLDNKGE